MSLPDPMHAVRAELRVALERRGFTQLTAVQRAVLEAATHERNLRLSSQTGSGKTVAIGLALAADLIDGASRSTRSRGPVALIIVPTRELAVQVREELSWLFAELPRFRTAVVTGGADATRERRALSASPDLLVATPGRLLDHMRTGQVTLESVRHVVLDEADRMLDMGFSEELDQIIAELPEHRRSHLVSATFPREVKRLADAFQHDALVIAGTAPGASNLDIRHAAYLVRAADHYAAVVNCLLLLDGAKCLIFVQRRADTSALSERLVGDGFTAMPISGDLSQTQRNRSLAAFRTGLVRTLVATDVAARGIDVADIAAVIHADLPRDSNDYIHRSGRTGRAGRQGRSITLVTPAQREQARRLFAGARVEVDWEPLPTAKKIEKTLEKRWRKQLHDRLAGPAPGVEASTYAQHLLKSYAPEQVIACLLELAQPTPPRPAMEIEPPPPPRARPEAPARRPRRSNAARPASGGPGGDRRRSGPSRERGRDGEKRGSVKGAGRRRK